MKEMKEMMDDEVLADVEYGALHCQEQGVIITTFGVDSILTLCRMIRERDERLLKGPWLCGCKSPLE